MFTDITVMQVVFLDYFFTFISSEVYPIDFWMFFKIIRISLRLMWSEQQNISGTQIFPFCAGNNVQLLYGGRLTGNLHDQLHDSAYNP